MCPAWSRWLPTVEGSSTSAPRASARSAGLVNLFYRIDRKSGVGGLWVAQILPFAEPISFGLYMGFETAANSGLRSGNPAAG